MCTHCSSWSADPCDSCLLQAPSAALPAMLPVHHALPASTLVGVAKRRLGAVWHAPLAATAPRQARPPATWIMMSAGCNINTRTGLNDQLLPQASSAVLSAPPHLAMLASI